MENFSLTATNNAQKITLDIKGSLVFVNSSYTKNHFEFYKPLIQWLKDYFKQSDNPRTTIHKDQRKMKKSSIYNTANVSAPKIGEDVMADLEDLKINMIAEQ